MIRCKSMVMENTKAPAEIMDCSDRNFSKYYLVIVPVRRQKSNKNGVHRC
jgi:hypothetical protein